LEFAPVGMTLLRFASTRFTSTWSSCTLKNPPMMSIDSSKFVGFPTFVGSWFGAMSVGA
jgi:hypothetical protein